MYRRVITIAVVGVFCAVVVGCGGGPDLGSVEGTVTYNGDPVEGATVTFKPEEGPLATGTTDSGGKFTLTTAGEEGAVLGKHAVYITKSAGGGGDAASMTPEDMKKMQEEGKAPEAKSAIPQKYASPKTSELTAEVTTDASKNKFDFTLTD